MDDPDLRSVASEPSTRQGWSNTESGFRRRSSTSTRRATADRTAAVPCHPVASATWSYRRRGEEYALGSAARWRSRDLQLPFNTGAILDIDRNELGGARRPGRRGRDPVFYAEWAARYVNACRTSETPCQFWPTNMPLGSLTIRGFLGEARRRGLLTTAPAGKLVGELTEKGKRLLDGPH